MIFMSAALLLSSCGLYNKYERPEVNTKGLVRDTQSLTDTLAVQDTTSFGNMPWRRVFTDPIRSCRLLFSRDWTITPTC